MFDELSDTEVKLRRALEVLRAVEWHEPRSSEAECPMCKAHAIHDGRLHARDCSLAALIGAKVAE